MLANSNATYWLLDVITGLPLAHEFHDKLKTQLSRQSMLGERRTYLWEEAVLRYLNETTHMRDYEGDKARLRWLHPHLEGLSLTEITRERMDEIKLLYMYVGS